MNKFFYLIRSAALMFGLSGCAIYPQPDDVTGLESKDVANVIRCQTRDAIRKEIIQNLYDSGDRIVFGSMRGPEAAQWFDSNPDNFIDISWTKFAPNLSRLFAFYADTTVSYDFSIDSSEMNGAGIDVTILKKLTSGTDSFGIVAKNDRARQVTRHFRVFDSFDTLVRKLPNQACADVPNHINGIYPSTGLLRIRSLVNNFLVQNQIGNLGGEKQNYTTAEMADTLVFTTKFVGNFSPEFSRDPILNKFSTSHFRVNSDNYRQDIHTIIILLSLPEDRSTLPKFDETGRLISPKQARQLILNRGLDREIDYRTSQKLQEIPSNLIRNNQ